MNYIFNDEDNVPMNENMLPDGRNCHQHCRYSKQCWELFNCKGENRRDFPDECALFYKLDDLAMEAADMAREAMIARGEIEDELPFTDEPEEGEEETDEF